MKPPAKVDANRSVATFSSFVARVARVLVDIPYSFDPDESSSNFTKLCGPRCAAAAAASIRPQNDMAEGV